jgi:hypothetical protein
MESKHQPKQKVETKTKSERKPKKTRISTTAEANNELETKEPQKNPHQHAATRKHNPTTQKRSYRTGIKTHLYLMYFMTASATTTDAERAPNPRFPERHTPSAAKAKQAADEKDLERR